VTTFALVHGAWHGAWCFERLAPALQALGHRVVAVDLPSDDAAATFDTYADVVVAALEAEADEPVVVGHSLAGLTIPLVAARRPVRRLVYLCALVPVPGRSFIEQRGDIDPDMLQPDYLAGMSEPDAQGRRRWIDEEIARKILYEDCDVGAASAAIERLRPQAQTPYDAPCLLDALPQTPSTCIVCGEDRLVNPDWSRRIAHERLGADLIELPGSHSPFLSRPDELAAVLHDRP
jgi:pimeloyl-ACP methyl ester carboxylesterase